MVLEPSWAALGGLLGRLGEAKCAKRAALERKKKNWAPTPRSGEGQGTSSGAQSARQRPPGEGIRGGGQWPKANIPDDGKSANSAREVVRRR